MTVDNNICFVLIEQNVIVLVYKFNQFLTDNCLLLIVLQKLILTSMFSFSPRHVVSTINPTGWKIATVVTVSTFTVSVDTKIKYL